MTEKELFSNLYSQIHGNPGIVKYGESETLILISLYENGYLLHLDIKQATFINCFYGDPTCGLISKDSKWAVMGGSDAFTIWHEGAITEITFKGAFDVRQTDTETVNILIDPWHEDAAIWELNIVTKELKMIRPFTDYINKEYTDNVIW